MIRDALMIELGPRAYRWWWYAMRNPHWQLIEAFLEREKCL